MGSSSQPSAGGWSWHGLRVQLLAFTLLAFTRGRNTTINMNASNRLRDDGTKPPAGPKGNWFLPNPLPFRPKVQRTGAAASNTRRARESTRGITLTHMLQPEYRERDRDHTRGSRDRSRSPVDRERSYRDRDDRERSNGAYNDRNDRTNTRTDGAMDDRQQNSQQDRRVYVGNLAYDVKWHHLKDYMREGKLSPH